MLCSPQSNGIAFAESKNRTLKEMRNAMLISFGLPQNMWCESILSSNYFLNKVPRKKKEKLFMSYGKIEDHPINTCENRVSCKSGCFNTKENEYMF